MERLHSLLRRQIKRLLGDGVPIPEDWKEFLKAVNEAYFQFDADRSMLGNRFGMLLSHIAIWVLACCSRNECSTCEPNRFHAGCVSPTDARYASPMLARAPQSV